MPIRRFSCFAICAIALLAVQPGLGLAKTQPKIALMPHRAVYELRLGDARSATGITGVDGRMVFEFSGSACEGYTLNMRMVTQMTDSQGETNVTDLRSSTWEQGDGMKFRFQSAQYLNDKIGDVTMGKAARDNSDAPVTVRLSQPSTADLDLPAKVLFPTQHTRAVLEAAMAGETKLEADLYDGSDKGVKVYGTTAFIGKTREAAPDSEMEPPAKSLGLERLRSWPVSIGYFESTGGDLTPAYQIDFLVYENGVSRRLRIDYGDFAIEGSLSRLEYLPAESCD